MCFRALYCTVRLMYIGKQWNPNGMKKAVYEGLYIEICFFGAKLSFEGNLMELSGIMSIHRGKNLQSLNLQLFSNSKEKTVFRNQHSNRRNGVCFCGNVIPCLNISVWSLYKLKDKVTAPVLKSSSTGSCSRLIFIMVVNRDFTVEVELRFPAMAGTKSSQGA